MVFANSLKEAKDIMKSIGLIKDDWVGEPGRTYWKLPEEEIVCQSTITRIHRRYGATVYSLSFFGKHAELYAAKYGKEDL